MEIRLAARGIIVHDNKLLVLKLNGYKHSKPIDYWCTPGGGVDRGEGLEAALEREMIEELGVKPVIGKLLYIQQYNDEYNENLEFFFHITNPKDYLNIDLSKTSHGIEEVEKVQFIDPLNENVKPVFLSESKIDVNQAQPLIFNYL